MKLSNAIQSAGKRKIRPFILPSEQSPLPLPLFLPLSATLFLLFLPIAPNPLLLFLPLFSHPVASPLHTIGIFSPFAISSFPTKDTRTSVSVTSPTPSVPPCTNTSLVPPFLPLYRSSRPQLLPATLPFHALHHKTCCPLCSFLGLPLHALTPSSPSRPQSLFPSFHLHL